MSFEKSKKYLCILTIDPLGENQYACIATTF